MIEHILAAALALGIGSDLPTSTVTPAQSVTACDGTPYECAVRHIEGGAFDAAIAELSQALAHATRDLRTLNLLGIALTGAGRIDEGNSRFREALVLEPGFTPARKNLAVNEFSQGHAASAERLFREVLAELPNDDIAHVHLGEIHHSRGEVAAAAHHYEKSGTRVTASPMWMLHYADSLLGLRQTTRAIAVLNELPQSDATSLFDAGVLLGRSGAYAEAARFFGHARSGYKDPYAAAYNQVLMLVEGGEHAGAVSVAEELFRAKQETGELYNLAARAYLALDRIQDAYDALRTAARLEPGNEQHYLDLALICLDHENFDLGLEIVEIGIRHTPDAADLHLHKGVLMVMKGLVEQAESEFERARHLAPTHPVPYVALAMAWMQSGRTPKAVDLLRQRVQAGAKDALLPYLFGIAIVRSGVNPEDEAASEAVQAFEAAIRLDAELAGPHAELGKILLARSDSARAIEYLERAVSLDPDSAGPAYALAQAYRRTGDTARARDLLERVSRLNARERGDDLDRELKRLVVRIVRQGSQAPAATRE